MMIAFQPIRLIRARAGFSAKWKEEEEEPLVQKGGRIRSAQKIPRVPNPGRNLVDKRRVSKPAGANWKEGGRVSERVDQRVGDAMG